MSRAQGGASRRLRFSGHGPQVHTDPLELGFCPLLPGFGFASAHEAEGCRRRVCRRHGLDLRSTVCVHWFRLRRSPVTAVFPTHHLLLADSDRMCEAAYYGDIAVLSNLISKGVDVHARGCCLLPMLPAQPIWFAALGGQCEAMRLLVRSGATTSDVVPSSLLTAICTSSLSRHHGVAQHRTDRPPPVVDFRQAISTIVSLGANINENEEDEFGDTELNRAAAHNNLEVLRALLVCGASVTDPQPLNSACKCNNYAAADELLLAGMQPLANTNGEDALMVAYAQVEMLPLLLAHGVVGDRKSFQESIDYMTQYRVRC